MPPEVMKRLIRRDTTGKVGAERIRVLERYLGELPGYYQGPYGKLRKEIKEEIERSRRKAKVTRRESFQIPKEGHRQVAVVGPPNAGKSALLRAMSGAQVRIADYPFATLKPQAAVIDVHGARVQLVEIPGFLPGANDDRGGGRALLAAVRTADIILYVASLGKAAAELGDLRGVMAEVEQAGIDRPSALCLTGLDLSDEPALEAGDPKVSGLGFGPRVAACSTVTGQGLDEVIRLVWSMCGLIRVWRRGESPLDHGNPKPLAGEGEPFILEAGSTIADLAVAIHKELGAKVTQATIWGPSARFPGQTVGLAHVLSDGDEVELRTRR